MDFSHFFDIQVSLKKNALSKTQHQGLGLDTVDLVYEDPLQVKMVYSQSISGYSNTYFIH